MRHGCLYVNNNPVVTESADDIVPDIVDLDEATVSRAVDPIDNALRLILSYKGALGHLFIHLLVTSFINYVTHHTSHIAHRTSPITHHPSSFVVGMGDMRETLVIEPDGNDVDDLVSALKHQIKIAALLKSKWKQRCASSAGLKMLC